MPVVWIIAGIVVLYFGGEALVSSASRLGRQLGMTPLAVGMTIVAFGTSAPELAATLIAARNGSTDLAFGNVIGSNLCNIGLILGLVAVIRPLRTHARFIWREVPFMVGVCALVWPLAADGEIGRLDGVLLLLLLAPFLWVLFRGDESARVEEPFAEAYGDRSGSILGSVIWVAAGVGLLVGGAELLVSGAVSLARTAQVPERTIGITLVAFGTSLPELASSLVAAFRKEADLVLGNLVGSNVFNVLVVLGSTATIHPVPVPFSEVQLDIGAMIAVCALTLPFLATGLRLGRREGAALLLAYGVYLGALLG